MRNRCLVGLGLAVLLWAVPPTPVAAQSPSGGVPVELGGLLRVGFRAEPEGSGEADGFDIFDARFSLAGPIGIVFDYFAQAEYDAEDDTFQLLDAIAVIPVMPELEVSFGLFRPAFGLEALEDKGDLTFLERAQATAAIAPGRQVGAAANGESLDGRLTYGAGLFNGNGRTLENDGDNYMFSARAQFNSIGTIAFYDDFVVQVGASFAYSSDTAADLGPGTVTGDPGAAPELTTAFSGTRTLWGADFQASYRSMMLTGEYLRADYDLDAEIGGGPPAETDAYGGYVELAYRAYGAIETVVRYDGFHPALGDNRDFLVFGFNVYPGYHAKFGLQYSTGLSDAPDSPTLADGQFLFVAQVAF